MSNETNDDMVSEEPITAVMIGVNLWQTNDGNGLTENKKIRYSLADVAYCRYGLDSVDTKVG
jgi:hypothetical protein